MNNIIIWHGISLVIVSSYASRNHKVYNSFFNNLFMLFTKIQHDNNLELYANITLPEQLFVDTDNAIQWFETEFNQPLWIECYDVIKNKSRWGPHYWTFMETIGGLINNINKVHVVKFLNDFQYVLPCPDCKMHYTQLINLPVTKRLRRTLTTRLDVQRYMKYLKDQVSRYVTLTNRYKPRRVHPTSSLVHTGRSTPSVNNNKLTTNIKSIPTVNNKSTVATNIKSSKPPPRHAVAAPRRNHHCHRCN
jgi:hypothetical protein